MNLWNRARSFLETQADSLQINTRWSERIKSNKEGEERSRRAYFETFFLYSSPEWFRSTADLLILGANPVQAVLDQLEEMPDQGLSRHCKQARRVRNELTRREREWLFSPDPYRSFFPKHKWCDGILALHSTINLRSTTALWERPNTILANLSPYTAPTFPSLLEELGEERDDDAVSEAENTAREKRRHYYRFWTEFLPVLRPRVVICLGFNSYRFLRRYWNVKEDDIIVGPRLRQEYPLVRMFDTKHGDSDLTVIMFPHPSTTGMIDDSGAGWPFRLAVYQACLQPRVEEALNRVNLAPAWGVMDFTDLDKIDAPESLLRKAYEREVAGLQYLQDTNELEPEEKEKCIRAERAYIDRIEERLTAKFGAPPLT